MGYQAVGFIKFKMFLKETHRFIMTLQGGLAEPVDGTDPDRLLCWPQDDCQYQGEVFRSVPQDFWG